MVVAVAHCGNLLQQSAPAHWLPSRRWDHGPHRILGNTRSQVRRDLSSRIPRAASFVGRVLPDEVLEQDRNPR